MPSHWSSLADGQTELLAGIGETTDKLLQAVFCVRSQGCVVGEQHLADENVSDFCFCTQSGNVEELAVSPGVYVDSLAAVLKGVLEEHGEKCLRKDAPMFHLAADWEGFGCRPIETDRALPVLMVNEGDVEGHLLLSTLLLQLAL